jgi:hypothetical protein
MTGLIIGTRRNRFVQMKLILVTPGPFLIHDLSPARFVTGVTRQVSLVEHE